MTKMHLNRGRSGRLETAESRPEPGGDTCKGRVLALICPQEPETTTPLLTTEAGLSLRLTAGGLTSQTEGSRAGLSQPGSAPQSCPFLLGRVVAGGYGRCFKCQHY